MLITGAGLTYFETETCTAPAKLSAEPLTGHRLKPMLPILLNAKKAKIAKNAKAPRPEPSYKRGMMIKVLNRKRRMTAETGYTGKS
jgi:hypothetical protein